MQNGLEKLIFLKMNVVNKNLGMYSNRIGSYFKFPKIKTQPRIKCQCVSSIDTNLAIAFKSAGNRY